MGTGRLVRELCYRLPEAYTLVGIVRHQLPRLDDIPYTSNNSSACAIIDTVSRFAGRTAHPGNGTSEGPLRPPVAIPGCALPCEARRFRFHD